MSLACAGRRHDPGAAPSRSGKPGTLSNGITLRALEQFPRSRCPTQPARKDVPRPFGGSSAWPRESLRWLILMPLGTLSRFARDVPPENKSICDDIPYCLIIYGPASIRTVKGHVHRVRRTVSMAQ